MNDNLLKEAKGLKEKIDKVKSKLEILEDYKKNYGRHYNLTIEYVKDNNGLVSSFVISSCNGDDEELLQARYCCDMIVANLTEFYKKKLDRLEFEFKNL